MSSTTLTTALLRFLAASACVAASLLAAGCDSAVPEPAPVRPTPKAQPTAEAQPTAANEPVSLSERTSRPAVSSLVAIGDLHGDLDHARRALRLAGAIDDKDSWIGGKLTVVQTGDEIDRGDDDKAIVDLIEKLKSDARKAGGEVIALLGNHELMNAALDFRYVTPGGYSAFSKLAPQEKIAGVPDKAQGRAAAFAPGGPYANTLASRPIVMKVGDSVFVHGGILPSHVSYGLDRMNDEVGAWLRKERGDAPPVVVAEDGPVWTRTYSSDTTSSGCATLAKVLKSLGAKRMVVGHTVQQPGVNSACDDKVWRIDVGLSHFYNGPIQVLKIEGDRVTVLKETKGPDAESK